MGKRKGYGPEKAGTAAPVKKRFRRYIAAAVIAVIVLVAIIVSTVLCVNFYYDKSRTLADELARKEQLMADLEEHLNGLKEENSALSAQLTELLNIQEAEPVITSVQIEEQLSAISELVTQKYVYTNASKGENNKTWLWGWDMPFSDKSFLVKYDGTIKAGIDLSAVKGDVNESSRTITVTLPASKITDNNVPQDTIEVFGIKDGLFNKVTPDDSNALISEGKKTMEAKAIERGLLIEASEEAKALVKAFLTLMPGMDTYTLEVR